VTPADRERLETAHKVLRSLRSADVRRGTEETNANGARVFVPALPDDTMGYLFERLRAADSPVHVAVRYKSGLFMFSMEPYATPRHARELPRKDDHCEIKSGTHVGMVVNYLRFHKAPVFLYEPEPTVALKVLEDTLAETMA